MKQLIENRYIGAKVGDNIGVVDRRGFIAPDGGGGGGEIDYSKVKYYDIAKSNNARFMVDGVWRKPDTVYSWTILLSEINMYSKTFTDLHVDWSKSFEVGIRALHYKSKYGVPMVLIGCPTNFWSIPSIEFSSSGGGIWCGISESSSAWNYNIKFEPNEVPISDNTIYEFLLKYDGESKVTFSVTVNGTTYTKEQIVTKIAPSSTAPISLFNVNSSTGHTADNVGIDFGNTYIKSEGELVWGAKKL